MDHVGVGGVESVGPFEVTEALEDLGLVLVEKVILILDQHFQRVQNCCLPETLHRARVHILYQLKIDVLMILLQDLELLLVVSKELSDQQMDREIVP